MTTKELLKNIENFNEFGHGFAGSRGTYYLRGEQTQTAIGDELKEYLGKGIKENKELTFEDVEDMMTEIDYDFVEYREEFLEDVSFDKGGEYERY